MTESQMAPATQTLDDIEIICINDGSTDGSSKIIEKYAKKDARIKVITKKNSGYGDSMNKGLAKATGEYIGIVESDDWAEPDMFEKLYKLAAKVNADVILRRASVIFHANSGFWSIKKRLTSKPCFRARFILSAPFSCEKVPSSAN